MVSTMDQDRRAPGAGAALVAFVLFALIACGSVLIAKRQGPAAHRRFSTGQVEESADGTRVTMAAVLREMSHASGPQAFRRGDLVAVAGKGRLDLAGARMEGDRGRMEAVVIAGSAELRVPADWQVVTGDSVILGRLSNRAEKAEGEARHTLRLEAVVLAGSLEISH